MKPLKADPRELVDLEHNYGVRQDLASSASKIESILTEIGDTDFRDNVEHDRQRVAQLLEGHELQSRRLSESLIELSAWQLGTTEIETTDFEKHATELVHSMEDGYKFMDQIDSSNKKSLELVRAARDRAARAEAQLRKGTVQHHMALDTNISGGAMKQQQAAASQSRGDLSDLDADKNQQAELQRLRDQAAKSHEGVQQAELEAQTMAHQLREAQETVTALREEYDQEMKKLSNVVANLEQKDRVVHVKWRDASVLAGKDVSAFHSIQSTLSPEVKKLQKEVEALQDVMAQERQKLASVTVELRSSRGIAAELEGELQRTREELRKVATKEGASIKVGELEPIDAEVERTLASKSPSPKSLIVAAGKLLERTTPAWDATKSLISHFESALNKKHQAFEESQKRVKLLESQLGSLKENLAKAEATDPCNADNAVEELRRAQEEVESCKKATMEMEQRAANAEEIATSTKDDLDVARSDLESTSKALAEVEDAIAAERERATEAEKELLQLRHQILEEKELKQKKREARAAKQQESTVQPSLSERLLPVSVREESGDQELDVRKSQLQESVYNLQIEEAELQAEIDHHRETILRATKEGAHLEESLDVHKREIFKLEKQEENYRDELKKLELHCQRLKSDIVFSQPTPANPQLSSELIEGGKYQDANVGTEQTFDCTTNAQWVLDQLGSANKTINSQYVDGDVDPRFDRESSTNVRRSTVDSFAPDVSQATSKTKNGCNVVSVDLENAPEEAIEHTNSLKARAQGTSQHADFAIAVMQHDGAKSGKNHLLEPGARFQSVHSTTQAIIPSDTVPSDPQTKEDSQPEATARHATESDFHTVSQLEGGADDSGLPSLNAQEDSCEQFDEQRHIKDVSKPSGGKLGLDFGASISEAVDDQNDDLTPSEIKHIKHNADVSQPWDENASHSIQRNQGHRGVRFSMTEEDQLRRLAAHVRKVEAELEIAKMEKMELALKTAEQRDEIAKLNAFLNKSQKVLGDLKTRGSLDSTGGRRMSRASMEDVFQYAEEADDEDLSELNSILSLADNLKSERSEKLLRHARLKLQAELARASQPPPSYNLRRQPDQNLKGSVPESNRVKPDITNAPHVEHQHDFWMKAGPTPAIDSLLEAPPPETYAVPRTSRAAANTWPHSDVLSISSRGNGDASLAGAVSNSESSFLGSAIENMSNVRGQKEQTALNLRSDEKLLHDRTLTAAVEDERRQIEGGNKVVLGKEGHPGESMEIVGPNAQSEEKRHAHRYQPELSGTEGMTFVLGGQQPSALSLRGRQLATDDIELGVRRHHTPPQRVIMRIPERSNEVLAKNRRRFVSRAQCKLSSNVANNVVKGAVDPQIERLAPIHSETGERHRSLDSLRLSKCKLHVILKLVQRRNLKSTSYLGMGLKGEVMQTRHPGAEDIAREKEGNNIGLESPQHEPLSKAQVAIRTLQDELSAKLRNFQAVPTTSSDEKSRSKIGATAKCVSQIEEYVEQLDQVMDRLSFDIAYKTATQLMSANWCNCAGEVEVNTAAVAFLLEHVFKLQDAVQCDEWEHAARIIGELMEPDSWELEEPHIQRKKEADWLRQAKAVLLWTISEIDRHVGRRTAPDEAFHRALSVAVEALRDWLVRERQRSFHNSKTGKALLSPSSVNVEGKSRESEPLRTRGQPEPGFLHLGTFSETVRADPLGSHGSMNFKYVRHGSYDLVRHGVANDVKLADARSQSEMDQFSLQESSAAMKRADRESRLTTPSSAQSYDEELQVEQIAEQSLTGLPPACASEAHIGDVEVLRDNRMRDTMNQQRQEYHNIPQVKNTMVSECADLHASARNWEGDRNQYAAIESNWSPPCVPIDKDIVNVAQRSGMLREEDVAREDSLSSRCQLPHLKSDEDFEKELIDVMKGVENESDSVVAVAERAGKVIVLERSLEQVAHDFEEYENITKLTEQQMKHLRHNRDVLRSRQSSVLECKRDVLAIVARYEMGALVQVRHEMKSLATKTKAMAGWISSLGISISQRFKVYEAAVEMLAREIESRGGWRAFIRLSTGDFNEQIDPALWPQGDAVRILEQLVHHYVQELAMERDRSLDFRKKIASFELQLERGTTDTLPSQTVDEIPKNREPNDAPTPHDDPLTLSWQQERLAAVKVHVDLVMTLQLALRSPLATKLKLASPPEVPSIEAIEKTHKSKKSTVSAVPCSMPSTRVDNNGWVLKKQLDKGKYALSKVRTRQSTTQPTTASRVPEGGDHGASVDRQQLIVASTNRQVSKSIQLSTQEERSKATQSSVSQAMQEKFPTQPTTSVRSAMELMRRVERLGAELTSTQRADAQVENMIRQLHPHVVDGLRKDVADIRLIQKFLKLAVQRDTLLNERITMLEREIEMLIRSHIAAHKNMRVLRAAFESEESATVIDNLRNELAQVQEKNARTEAALLVLQQTSALAGSGQGKLELLEAMMQRHQRVSAIHAALLPKYDEVEAKLYAVMAKLKRNKGKSELLNHSAQLVEQKNALELRLYVAFREAEEVEKLMVCLYERVEAATQYVFSGQCYRGMLIWAADKEAHFNQPPSPRLAAAARTVVAPVRSLLQSINSPQLSEGENAVRRHELRKMPLPYSRQRDVHERVIGGLLRAKGVQKERPSSRGVSESRSGPILRTAKTVLLSAPGRSGYQ